MRRLAPVLWAVVVLLSALPPLAAGYSAGWALPVLAACVMLPFGLAALGRLTRVPRWSVATAGLVVGVVVALVFADRVDPASGALPTWRSSPGFSALGPLIDAVPRLLTAPRPAPPDPSLLVPAALFTWIVALAVAVAVTGTRRAGVAPLLGAVALHTAGGLLTAGRGDVLGTSALATAVALLLGWVLLPASEPRSGSPSGTSPARPARSRSATRRRRGVVLPAIAATVIATFALAAVAVPTAGSFEPRTLVPPPQLPADAANPVPQAAAWAQRPGDEMVAVTAVEGDLPERLALAVLPDYTGVAWTLDAQLRPVGVVATPDATPASATRTATFTVTAHGYAEAWLPSAGTATDVTGVFALLDLDTGTLVLPNGWVTSDPRSTDTATATITSRINAATPEAIGRASVPQAADVQRYLELPRVRPEFAEAARLVTDGVSNRWEQVSRLADAVRTDGFRADSTGAERVLDHGARSGSSYARLVQFLFASPEEGGQVGTSEQFASSFAVMARTLGIPTRLVVGFQVPDDGGTGTAVVHGEDARVWAEVYLNRIGWVAVDPSPDSAISTDLPTPEADTDTGDDPKPDPVDDEEDREVVEPEDQSAVGAALPGLLGWSLLAVAVLGVIGLGIARAVRAARWRRAGEPGAWAHVEDAMRLVGTPPARGSTATDLAAALPEDVAAIAVALAERAEAGAFAPEGTSLADGGTSAWEMSRTVSSGLRRGTTRGRRLLWWVSPRVWRR